MPPLLSRRCAVLALTALALGQGPARAVADEVTVFAAASLAEALGRVTQDWTEATGHSVVLSFAGSSAIARQIQQGAPADLVFLASADWMEALAASGDLREGTRRDILGNALVLIAHGPDAAPVTLDASLDLAGRLDGGFLAMALVDSVPAGIYGRQALTALGLWDSVAQQVAQTDNVRAALAFVARGEAPLGIVFATDAAIEEDVSILGTFPAESHAPIVYPAAITAQSRSAAAADLLDYLSAPEARQIWSAFGFGILGE